MTTETEAVKIRNREQEINKTWALRSLVLIPFLLPYMIAFWLFGLTMMVTWWDALRIALGR